MLARLKLRLPVRFSIDSLSWVGRSQFRLGKWDLRGESLLEDFFVQQRRFLGNRWFFGQMGEGRSARLEAI